MTTEKQQKAAIKILNCFNFVIGESEDTLGCIQDFIDARSRIYELHEVFGRKYRKAEAIKFFMNHTAKQRREFITQSPGMIIALPCDCKTLGIVRPFPRRYQSSSFGGKTVEYPVFDIADILGNYSSSTLELKTASPATEKPA